MGDRPLSVTNRTQKLQSDAGIPNSTNFSLQADIYRPPSVSPPPNLSDEPDYEHLMAIKMRDAEAPATSRSCSSSSSVDENVSNLPRNVDKHNEADIDSEGLSSDNEVIRRAPGCSIRNQMDTCEHCGLARNTARTDLHLFKNNYNIRHCICHLVASCQPKLADRQRLKRRLNKVVPSRNSSHDSTENVSLKAESYSPCLNSSQGDLSFSKEEEEDMENANCDTLPTDDASTFLANTTEAFNGGKTKKNKIRQEVDPRKYFIVVEGECGSKKYACSQCADVPKMYSWKKSLNKHWKEKHDAINLEEMTDSTCLTEFMTTGKYTLVGDRQLYDTAYLRTIQITESDNTPGATSTHAKLSKYANQPDRLNISTSLPSSNDFPSPHIPSFARMVDPFNAAHTAFPGFPMAVPHFPVHSNYYDSSEVAALDLSFDRNHSSRNSSISGTPHQSNTLPSDHERPMNFSRDGNSVESVTPEIPRKHVKSVLPSCSIEQSVKELPRCLKFESSSASETESCTKSHMHKKVATCHECKHQNVSMDLLNKHFTKHHLQKLSDYKETVKKIPHGLQQAYHLLNMELNDIVALGNLDHGLPDGISLKCKKCDFETMSATDFQRHGVSHAEERPYACMVCGATYKFKWDLVKHFEKSHANLPNPYRRNDRKDASDESSEEYEPLEKMAKFEQSSASMNSHPCSRNYTDSVEAVTIGGLGQATVSCQQTDLGSAMEKKPIDQYMDPTEVTRVVSDQMAHTSQTQQKDRSHKAHADKSQQHMSNNHSHVSFHSKTGRAMREDSGSSEGSKPEKILNNQRKTFNCYKCDKEYCFLSELQQHEKKHSNFKPYKCRFGEYRSKWKWDTAKHERRCPGGCSNDISTKKLKKVQTSLDTGPQNAPEKKKIRVNRTIRQPAFSCTNQSANQSDSFLSNTETKENSPKSHSKAFKRKNQSNANSSNCNYAVVDKNHTAQPNGLQIVNLKQTPPSTSTGDAIPSSSSSIASTKRPQSRAKRSGDVSSSASWKCFHCFFTTHTQIEFKRHLQELHNEDKPFKCDRCDYRSKWPCDLKKHKLLYNHFPETEIEETKEEFQPLFKCSHCAIYLDTLQKLTDHCLTDHSEELSHKSSVSVMENAVDMARIKHPRKRVTLIQCSQCPFVCTSQQMMNTHLIKSIHCVFCKSMFNNKESFFDHIIQHPEFTPQGWELFFMISESEHHQLKSDRKTNLRADKKQHGQHCGAMEISQNISTCKDEKKITTGTDPLLNRKQPMQVEIKKSGQDLKPQLTMHTCEWCYVEFNTLTTVYNHARRYHPVELKEQVARTALADDGSPQMSCHTNDMNRERDYNLVDKCNEEFVSRIQVGLNKKMDDNIFNLSLASFACKKQPNECKPVFQCQFCSFSVDDAKLLEQHMATSHGCEWQVPKQNFMPETDHQRIRPASSSTRSFQDRDSLPCSPQDAMDVTSKTWIAHKMQLMLAPRLG